MLDGYIYDILQIEKKQGEMTLKKNEIYDFREKIT